MRSWIASRSALLALVLWAAGGPRGAAQGSGLDELLRRFRDVPGMECRFREEKRIALLTTPIVSEGTLYYAPPGRLLRRVTAPSPQVVLIDGGQLRMRDGTRVETIDLDAQPVVRGFVDTFALLLAGDRAGLERQHRIAYTPGANGWTLVLVPRAAPLGRFLREIRFEGNDTTIVRMVMTEQNGDVTSTTFHEVNVRRRYAPDEAARLFTL